MHQCKDWKDKQLSDQNYFDRLENVVMGPTPTNLVSNIKMSWRFSTNQLQHVWHVNWLTGVQKGEGAQVVLTTWHFKSRKAGRLLLTNNSSSSRPAGSPVDRPARTNGPHCQTSSHQEPTSQKCSFTHFDQNNTQRAGVRNEPWVVPVPWNVVLVLSKSHFRLAAIFPHYVGGLIKIIFF